MTDRELMQQALEALEMADELCNGHGVNFKEYGLEFDKDIQRKYKVAVTALRERLAHCDRCGKRLGGESHIHTCTPLKQKRFEQWWDAGDDIPNDAPYTPDTPIQFAWAGWQAALAQPEQEPDPIGDAQDRLIAEMAAQPEQEPVAYLCENAVGHKYFRWKKPSSTYKPIALYTPPPPCPTCEALARTVMLDQTSHDVTPPKRKPLTESMIKAGLAELEAIRQTELVGDYELIKRLLEAAHGIKETEK